MSLSRTLPFALLLPLTVSCASTSAAPAFRDVAKITEERSGHRVAWDQASEGDDHAKKAVERLLQSELTVEAAVQIALLASPRLRATFEDLAVAQADLVQAGLLKNPVFSIGRTAWDEEHIAPNIFLGVEQDFLDLLTLPLKKRVAATELERVKLEVGDEVLKTASEVRTAFYTALASHQVASVRRLIADAARVSADLAKRQYDAGNMNDLALSAELGLASQAKLDATKSDSDAAVAREHLNKLLGLWGERTSWKLPARLPELPKEEAVFDRLEAIAIEKRLDIAAARREVQALDSALTLTKTTRWTGVVTVHVEAGRLRGSKHISLGPSVALEIPLFDQRQAAVARLEAFKRQAERTLEALSIEARSDVRAASARLTTARSIVEEYGGVLVPLRENVVRFSQQQYDAMLLGVYQLLQAKQLEFQTYRETIDALRDYWIARSDLERAIGTRLVSTQKTRASAVPPQAAPPSSTTSAPHVHGGHGP